MGVQCFFGVSLGFWVGSSLLPNILKPSLRDTRTGFGAGSPGFVRRHVSLERPVRIGDRSVVPHAVLVGDDADRVVIDDQRRVVDKGFFGSGPVGPERLTGFGIGFERVAVSFLRPFDAAAWGRRLVAKRILVGEGVGNHKVVLLTNHERQKRSRVLW